jgi:hypothetical protein
MLEGDKREHNFKLNENITKIRLKKIFQCYVASSHVERRLHNKESIDLNSRERENFF